MMQFPPIGGGEAALFDVRPAISHAIRLRELSTTSGIVAIPTMPIQILKESQGNCMRNCWVHDSHVGLAAVPVGGGGAWPGFEATHRTRQ